MANILITAIHLEILFIEFPKPAPWNLVRLQQFRGGSPLPQGASEPIGERASLWDERSRVG